MTYRLRGVDLVIEVFAHREDAEKMLRDCLSDEPEWAAILEVVPVELEFSPDPRAALID